MGISIDEKRVYDADEGPIPVFVVGEFGVARVDTSDDLVGEFGLARRCSARDAAGRDGRLAVATDEDVLVGVAGGDDHGEDEESEGNESNREIAFEALGVGPAVAVGFAGREDDREDQDDREDYHLIVAREDGRVVRQGGADAARESGSDESWTELGELATDSGDGSEVRAIDGDLVAAESGVYRVVGDRLQHVGLDDARGVSAEEVPLAATAEGLYRLGNGWMDELAGDFRAVSAAPAPAPAGAGAGTGSNATATEGTLGWAHAASAEGLYARENGEWREAELPVAGEVVAVDHGEEGVYAVTEDGTFLLSVGDGWNHQILGLRGVRAVAAP